MNLQRQDERRQDGQRQHRREDGYAMAALLVALAVMAVMLTVAMPVWNTAAKREKEEELIWRAGQYARAVALFRRKYANASPPSLDLLINERFLRKKYKDPMTKDGEFALVYATSQQQRPGQPSNEGIVVLDPAKQGMVGGARGGIIGVVSKSTEKSLRTFNGRTKYSEWPFTPETVGPKVTGVPVNAPGGNVPGGAAGTFGPGGRPGQSGPGASRGRLGFDPAGRPVTQPPNQQGPPGQPGPPGQQPPRPFGLPTQRPPQ